MILSNLQQEWQIGTPISQWEHRCSNQVDWRSKVKIIWTQSRFILVALGQDKISVVRAIKLCIFINSLENIFNFRSEKVKVIIMFVLIFAWFWLSWKQKWPFWKCKLLNWCAWNLLGKGLYPLSTIPMYCTLWNSLMEQKFTPKIRPCWLFLWLYNAFLTVVPKCFSCWE